MPTKILYRIVSRRENQPPDYSPLFAERDDARFEKYRRRMQMKDWQHNLQILEVDTADKEPRLTWEIESW